MRNTIIYYGNILYPDKDAAAHRSIGNAKALRELGYNVVLVGTRAGEKRSLLETKEIYDGFDVYYFPDPVSHQEWKDYLFDFKPLKQVILHEEHVNSVILYNHPSISSRKVYSFCHKKGIKVYADCTEWFDPKGFNVHDIIKRLDTWYRMHFVNRKLDGIIAISSFLQNYYNNYGCKTICIPPLIDMSDIKWKINSIEKIRKDTRLVKLCYVGTPGAGTKDKLNLILKTLQKILVKYPEIMLEFSIVGMTAEQYQVAFHDNYSGYGFAIFLGRMTNSEALTLIKKSDYSIFLRDNNLVCTAGFPTKFSESIACGTPVLTNITSDLGRYLKNGVNGYAIDVSSESSMIDSLYDALSLPCDKIDEMKTMCREEKTFDYHSFVNEFALLLE